MCSGRVSISLAALALGAITLTVPQPAHATVVAATICIGPEFPCAPADTVDFGSRANGVGLLGPNRFAALPFVFNDALMNFAGNVLVVDRGGTFIYSWGTGTATETAAGNAFGATFGFAGNLYLDVGITQSYVTAPGNWNFAEMNVGTCNVAAALANSGDFVRGFVNGNGMATLPGPCVAAPFAFGSGPYNINLGLVTNLTALAQFVFGPGGSPQSITLPWGDDLPDQNIDFGDPNAVINSFITPDNLPSDFIDAAPEPASFSLIGGGLMVAGALLRRRKR